MSDLLTVKTEAAPGGLIKAEHIDTIVDSITALENSVTADISSMSAGLSSLSSYTINNVSSLSSSLTSFESSITSVSIFASLGISATATDVPVIINTTTFGFGGSFSVESVTSGVYRILDSASGFSETDLVQITSRATNVNFYVSTISAGFINIILKDSNGYNASLSSGEGFYIRVEK